MIIPQKEINLTPRFDFAATVSQDGTARAVTRNFARLAGSTSSRVGSLLHLNFVPRVNRLVSPRIQYIIESRHVGIRAVSERLERRVRPKVIAMICQSCGKEIPDESRFCLYCGFRAPTEEPKPVVAPSPLFSLEVVDFKACGPTIVESGYLNERLRRGFEFTICVRDSSGIPIVSEGELTVALKGPYPNNSSSPHLLEPTSKMARSIGTRTDILWHRSFVLKRTDFGIHSGQETDLGPADAAPFLAYSYHETAPILSVDADYYVELHTWFVMPTNQCLYQASVALWSR